ncbi:hypothetical protein HanRHA438_Chr11g0526651 [Helianthus annuus]|nr:hypothetical protein HanRHA438_Chr11g0526651 [Helianthus annuus]
MGKSLSIVKVKDMYGVLLSANLHRVFSSCYMSVETLKKLSLNSDFHPHVTTPLVMDALFFKSYSSCASTVNPHFVDKYRPPSRCLSSTCHSRDVLFTLTNHTRFVEACYHQARRCILAKN